MAEDSFDSQKRMLDLDSDTGFHPLNLVQQAVIGELRAASETHGDFPVDRSVLIFFTIPPLATETAAWHAGAGNRRNMGNYRIERLTCASGRYSCGTGGVSLL